MKHCSDNGLLCDLICVFLVVTTGTSMESVLFEDDTPFIIMEYPTSSHTVNGFKSILKFLSISTGMCSRYGFSIFIFHATICSI